MYLTLENKIMNLYYKKIIYKKNISYIFLKDEYLTCNKKYREQESFNECLSFFKGRMQIIFVVLLT